MVGKTWEEVRQKPMLYWDEIFEALARTIPDHFRNASAAQEAYDRSHVQLTFQQLAKELVAYVDRQQAQHRDRRVRLMFIIDELGQFVADSGPRLLDMQSFVEEIGIYGKVYLHFQKAKHVVVDEKKAIKAILNDPPSQLHQVEPPLGLFDRQGGLNRASRALDDVYSFLEAEARAGRIVTGKSLTERYESIPYGWDSNVARLCAAALFRTGALLLTVDKRDYRDPRDAEVQKIFQDSRRFDHAELHLESDVDLSVEERMRAREQIHVLFGARPEETPAALAETLQKKLRERLETVRGLAQWVRLTAFPAPTSYSTAAESFERLAEEPRPNGCVRYFLNHLEEVAAQVRVVDALQQFFSSHRREEYERAQPLLEALRVALRESLATEAMRRAIEEYDGRSRDRELLDRWAEVQGHLLAALGDLKELYQRLHREADDAYSAVAAEVEGYAAERGLASRDVADLASAAREKECGHLEGWTPESGYQCTRCHRDLTTLVNAPLAAERLRGRLITRIDDRVAPKPSPEGDGAVKVARKVRSIKVAEAAGVRRIREPAEWEKARDRLDAAVRGALAEGDEVELS